MKTIIPAQPGVFVVYPDGDVDLIIAWEISHHPALGRLVFPITTSGDACEAGYDYEIRYIDARGSTITLGS